jgi:hypothetical protein
MREQLGKTKLELTHGDADEWLYNLLVWQ